MYGRYLTLRKEGALELVSFGYFLDMISPLLTVEPAIIKISIVAPLAQDGK